MGEIAQNLAQIAKQENSPLIISPEIQRIQGRIISDAPMYLTKPGGKQPMKLAIGDLQAKWNKNGMFDQTTLKDDEWAIVYSKKVAKKAKKLEDNMRKATKGMGNNVLGKAKTLEIQGMRAKSWEKELNAFLDENPNLRAIVFVVPV